MLILQKSNYFWGILDFNDENKGLKDLFKTIQLLKENIYINTNSSNKCIRSNDRVFTRVSGIMAYLMTSTFTLKRKII